jgi:ribosomal protein L12E/L44/L45/RPP1/RPP2
VSYEALREHPEPELRAILQWLGKEVDNARVAESVRALSFENLPEAQKGAGQFVRAAQPGLWRERFSDDECSAMEAIMGPTLAAFGYLDNASS